MAVDCPKQDAYRPPKKSGESDTVKLNVGGRVFEAPLAMLQQYPHTMLGTMFNGLHHVEPNTKGEFAFYRDPGAFEKIMKFYRTGRVDMSAMTLEQTKVLFADAKYFLVEKEIFGEAPKFIEPLTVRLKAESKRFVDFPESVEFIRLVTYEITKGTILSLRVLFSNKVQINTQPTYTIDAGDNVFNLVKLDHVRAMTMTTTTVPEGACGEASVTFELGHNLED